MTWKGNRLPEAVTDIRTVTYLLSSYPMIATCFVPSLSMLHSFTGTNLDPVWSQLIMRPCGMFHVSTSLLTLKECLLYFWKIIRQLAGGGLALHIPNSMKEWFCPGWTKTDWSYWSTVFFQESWVLMGQDTLSRSNKYWVIYNTSCFS